MGRRSKTYNISLIQSVLRYLMQFFIPLIAVTFILNLFAFRIIYQREMDKKRYEVAASASALSNYIDQVESLAFDISINSHMQDLLLSNSSPYISALLQSRAFDSMIGLNRYHNLNIIHISIMTPERNPMLSVGYNQTEPFAEDVPFSLSPDYSKWSYSGSTTYYNQSKKPYTILSYYQKVFGLASNRYIGIVRVDIDEKTLREIYRGTGFPVLRELYLTNQDGEKLLVSQETAGDSDFLSDLSHLKEVTAGVNENFTFSEKFDLWQLVRNNNFVLPLAVFAGIFAVLFVILSYRFLHLVVSPIYKLNETIQNLDPDAPLLKLELKEGSREMKVIYNGFNQLVESLNRYIGKNREIMHQEELARTLYFQSQINPHFLYNTLDTIRWIALKNKDREAAGEIYNLSNIYRYYLNHGNAFVTLREEINLINTYMAIQNLRFYDKFDFRQTIEKAAEGFLIPKLLLQPLIENSVQHAFGDREEDCIILFSARFQKDGLLIRIFDNGCGMPKELLAQIRTGSFPLQDSFAIANIQKRLELYYGGRASLSFIGRERKGTLIKIKLPCSDTGKEGDTA